VGGLVDVQASDAVLDDKPEPQATADQLRPGASGARNLPGEAGDFRLLAEFA
jgi:hypothetical protein